MNITLSACLSPGWEGAGSFYLTQRQSSILFLLSEGEHLGLSEIASELNTSVSTHTATW